MEERKDIALQDTDVPDNEREEGYVELHPALFLIGKKKRIERVKKQDTSSQVEAYWAECRENGVLDTIAGLVPHENCYIAACTNFAEKSYDYWIAVSADADTELPPGFDVLETDEMEYATFSCTGPAVKAIFDRWTWIYREWFPKEKYLHRDAPELEVYPYGNMDAEDYRCEIRVPVKKMQTRRPRKRYSMRAMMVPLIGVMAGVVIGTRLGNTSIGMLIGLIGGLVASAIMQQMENNDNKEKGEDAEKQE